MVFEPTGKVTNARLTGRSQSLWLPGARKCAVWAIILASAILVLLLGQGIVTEELNRPLGPTLPPVATPTSTRAAVEATKVAQPVLVDPTLTPLCGGPEHMIILAAGIDRRAHEQDRTGLVDVIRIIRIDFVKADVRILAIPRDLWVLIPGLEGHTKPEGYFGYPIVDGEVLVLPGDHGRINASYFYGQLYDLTGGGPGILAQTLYENFGLAADHYAIADMQTFSEAIDAIGGIDVYLPVQLEGFEAGWHHMDGATALEYSRIRKPDTDWDRIDRQSQVLLALGKQALDPKNLPSLPALANSFLDDIVTDLSKAELGTLTCLASKISNEGITTYRIGPEMVIPVATTRSASVMLPKMVPVRALITGFLSDEEEPPTPGPD